MTSWRVLLIVAGLLALGFGLWELRTMAWVRREGIRSTGIVLRYARHLGSGPDGEPVFAPVVHFQDEQGRRREFESAVRTGTPRYDPGTEVPVVHLPGRPETARLDMPSDKLWLLILTLSLGVILLAAAVIVRP